MCVLKQFIHDGENTQRETLIFQMKGKVFCSVDYLSVFSECCFADVVWRDWDVMWRRLRTVWHRIEKGDTRWRHPLISGLRNSKGAGLLIAGITNFTNTKLDGFGKYLL